MKTHLALIACFTIIGNIAYGQNTIGAFIDGNELLAECDNRPMSALGYVSGIVDYSAYASHISGDRSVAICSPTNATGRQLTDVVCKFLKDEPSYRHLDGAMLAADILQKAYPCTN